MVKKISPLAIVIFFTVLAGLGLLHSGLIPTHDGEYHIVRFYEFNQSLQDGNWYPRWAPDLNYGFGVPLFNYVYPFPNYIASCIHTLGFSFIDAFKLNLFMATIVGGIFFYLWAKMFWGEIGGIVSSTFYSFSPYRLVDIYIRGSVGEVWALSFFPAFLWSATSFFQKRNEYYLLLSSIFLALTILSHNILALMFFFFDCSYIVFLIFTVKKRSDYVYQSIFLILLGLGLSSIFWIPALIEKNFVTGLEIFDYQAHFPEVYQLLIPSWGSGFSGGNLGEQMSFQIGLANLFAVTLGILCIILYFSRKQVFLAKTIIFSLLFFSFIFFMMTRLSIPIWEKISLLRYFQFPWRFLSITILLTSFLAGGIFPLLRKNQKLFMGSFMILVTFLLGYGYAKPAYYQNRNDDYYLNKSIFIDGTNSPGNYFNTIWINTRPKREPEKLKINKGKGSIKINFIKSTHYNFSTHAETQIEILVNTAFFPGWAAYIDNKQQELSKSTAGLFMFNIPSGDHQVEVKFENTLTRNISQILSGMALIYISYQLLFNLKRQKKYGNDKSTHLI
ncbi:MAG: 6-pyruvoyl-tetrahydropterin synthase-related protein [Candidatus Gottesmanbacteria bacterium]